MKSNTGKLIATVLSLLILFSASLFGCQNQTNSPLTPESPFVVPSQSPNNYPQQPITVKTSFPDGAPPLNQVKELRVTVKTYNNIPAKAMSIQVILPDSFELLSGTLSWTGDIPINNEIPVIKAMVKPIKAGSWGIEVTSYIDPKEHAGYGGTGHNPVYVLVSEYSAEWRLKPYGSTGTSPLPPGQALATSATSP